MMLSTTEDGNPLHLFAIVPVAACDVMEDMLDGELHLVCGKTHAAVVRPAEDAVLAGQDRQELARRLLAHQQVTEKIMARAPVLPVKFGTVAPDRAHVERCLARGAVAFTDSFAALADRVQYEILVSWDPGQVLAEIAETPEVARLKRERVEPVQLGAAVKGMFDARRAELAEGLATALRRIAADAVDNALMDDRMVLNLALLVDAGSSAALDTCLETLDASHEGRLNFRCVGPLPPHSFGTVEVSFLDERQIAWARGVLELDEGADADALRSAYHRLAKKLHPDAAGAASDGREMTDLHQAYQTLRSVVEAQGSVLVSVARRELKPEGIAS